MTADSNAWPNEGHARAVACRACSHCVHGDKTVDSEPCSECYGKPTHPSFFAAISNGPARKDDDGKVRMELIPPELFVAVGNVLTYGAKKYSSRQWESGLLYSRCYGALLRHVTAWWAGEDTDPESGLPHLHHAACCVTFLLTYDARGMGSEWDDRPAKDAPIGERDAGS